MQLNNPRYRMPKINHRKEKSEIAWLMGYPDHDTAIYCLYNWEIKSTSQIADIFNVTSAAINVRLKKMNSKIRGRGGPNRRGK